MLPAAGPLEAQKMSPEEEAFFSGFAGVERAAGSIRDRGPHARLVPPLVLAAQPVACEEDSECTASGEICGVHPQRWADGSYRGGVEQGSCGTHVAWVSHPRPQREGLRLPDAQVDGARHCSKDLEK